MAEKAPGGLDMRDRVIWVIHECVGTWKKYPYLEERTGIKARRWQNVCHRVQQPTLDMLSALAEVRPYFIAWMLTGKSLALGQVNPEKDDWFETLDETHRKALHFLEGSGPSN